MFLLKNSTCPCEFNLPVLIEENHVNIINKEADGQVEPLLLPLAAAALAGSSGAQEATTDTPNVVTVTGFWASLNSALNE